MNAFYHQRHITRCAPRGYCWLDLHIIGPEKGRFFALNSPRYNFFYFSQCSKTFPEPECRDEFSSQIPQQSYVIPLGRYSKNKQFLLNSLTKRNRVTLSLVATEFGFLDQSNDLHSPPPCIMRGSSILLEEHMLANMQIHTPTCKHFIFQQVQLTNLCHITIKTEGTNYLTIYNATPNINFLNTLMVDSL